MNIFYQENQTNAKRNTLDEKSSNQTFKLSPLDKKVLSLLLSNARLSYRQIARKTKTSVATVIQHIRNLESKGVIKYYTAVLDHEKIGYEISAIIEIVVSKGKLTKVEEEIAKHKNVCAVYDVTGLTDAIVIAKFKSRKELSEFVKSLLAMEYIERTNTHLILNTVKEDFRLL